MIVYINLICKVEGNFGCQLKVVESKMQQTKGQLKKRHNSQLRISMCSLTAHWPTCAVTQLCRYTGMDASVQTPRVKATLRRGADGCHVNTPRGWRVGLLPAEELEERRGVRGKQQLWIIYPALLQTVPSNLSKWLSACKALYLSL